MLRPCNLLESLLIASHSSRCTDKVVRVGMTAKIRISISTAADPLTLMQAPVEATQKLLRNEWPGTRAL